MPKAKLSTRPPTSAMPTKLAWALTLAAAIIAALLAADSIHWVISAYSGLPFWDQWDRLIDVEMLRTGAFGLSDLFAQHGEHRIAFPRLVFLADAMWTGQSDILNLAAIGAIQAAHAVLLIGLLRPLTGAGRIAAAAAIVALLGFLGQWENFVWGFQVQFVGVYLLASLVFVCTARAAHHRSVAAFAGACLCVFVAAFTMANGLAAGAIAALLAVVLGAPAWMSLGLAALTGACAALYAIGYTPTPDHTTPAYALSHLGEYAAYVCAYVGNIAGLLADRPPTAKLYAVLAQGPIVLGAAGLVLAAAALWRETRARFSERTQAVLLAIMAFVLASAALTAFGRLDYGLSQAHSPRYQTAGAVFWVAQIVYWTRALDGAGVAARRAGAVALMGLLALLTWSQVNLGPVVERHGIVQRAAADALRSRVRDDAAVGAAYPRPGEVWGRIKILQRYRLSIFADPQTAWLGRPLASVAGASPAGACIGAFDDLHVPSRNAAGDAVALGWAWSEADDDAPRRIVLTNAAGTVIGFGSTGSSRPDVPAVRPEVDDPASGWSGFAQVGAGETRAFAVLKDGTACPLGAQADAPRR